MNWTKIVAYVCATVIVISAFHYGYDGYLALICVAGMLGIDYILQRRHGQ